MTTIVLTITIVTVASFLIFQLWRVPAIYKFRLSNDRYIDSHVKYQISLFLLALAVVVSVYLIDSDSLDLFLRAGDIFSSSSAFQWLWRDREATWLSDSVWLLVFITSGTSIFVYGNLKKQRMRLSILKPYIFWIILLALSNSLSEELVFRIGIVSPLYALVDPYVIAVISALLFGLAHFGGMPHGILGMIMAAILGWFLALSVIETRGLLIAWIIHFVQDLVIYTGMIVWHVENNLGSKATYFGGQNA